MSFTVSPRTDAAQAEASDPARSAFVSANAGSGKTHVLTQRVVRLLLSGAEPSRILCLTYTKAAAAEMANRVFGRLALFATQPKRALDADLRRLLGRTPRDPDRIRARQLFACALETPGGLKIQTIHAFCEAILHQFPIEAGVPGHFEVMDDAESALLLAEARRRLVTGGGLPFGRQPSQAERDARVAAFADALGLAGEKGLDSLLREIVSKRDAIRRHMEETGDLPGALGTLAESLGLPPGADEAAALAAVWPCPGLDEPFLRDLAATCRRTKKSSDGKFADGVDACFAPAALAAPEARLAALGALLLTKEGQPKKKPVTKAVLDALPELDERLARAFAHVEAMRDRLASLRLYRASAAALILADALERDYALLKRRRGRLDFEDLIVATADLLTRSDASAWVHYKLDQGIDHVLIDEAQDTSPRQWEVMRSLIDEFFVGQTAREAKRTIFAVGDEKQSIYSFQGALPRMFADERRSLLARAQGAERAFSVVELHQSFRSSGVVLQAVDRVFSAPENRRGLSADDRPPAHETVRQGTPGLVELWPAFVSGSIEEPEDWLEPVDVQPENAPTSRLARRIAETVKGWLGDAIETRDGPRPLGPGDVLVLVRKRSPFVDAMGKALRDAGIPVAGADRLLLTDHIAVCDLISLGRAVVNVDDELSLAEALKSPLFDFSEDELMALALVRDPFEPLSLSLRRMGTTEGAARASYLELPGLNLEAFREKSALAGDRLDAMRDRAGFAGPFTFFARVLAREGGRAALVRRLGEDAGEVIDAFLDLALAHEDAHGPGLDAFLAELVAEPPQIKREMEHGRGEVRIMTVHASKGLEAPVVFLVDPGSAPFHPSHGAKMMRWEDMPGLPPYAAPGFLWRASTSARNAALQGLAEVEKRGAEDEYRRLLYVGMTRAADRLVLCGTAGAKGPHDECWLRIAERALEPVCEEILDANGERLCLRFGSAEDGAAAAARAPRAAEQLAFDLTPLAPEPRLPRTLAPSGAASAVAVEASPALEEAGPAAGRMQDGTYLSPVLDGGAEPGFAIRRGIAAHRLLQVLPELAPQAREPAAMAFLESAAGLPDAAARAALWATVRRIMEEPRFAPAFAPGSRAEVPIAGTIEVGGRPVQVSGSIDRLAVSETRVLVVDYKTNRPAPCSVEEVPEEYRLQLALYRAMLQPIYPGRRVEAALLFTEGPHWVEMPDEVLDAALRGSGRETAEAPAPPSAAQAGEARNAAGRRRFQPVDGA